MNKTAKAALLAALMAVPQAAPTSVPGNVMQAGQQQEKQAPPLAAAVAAELAVLADAGVPFTHQAHGIPWPGRTAARARRGPGAYWSGR